MKRFKYLLLFFFFTSGISAAFAQGIDNIWAFGWNVGLDFTTGNPIGFVIPGFNSFEGCASVCDTNGHLLFYTEGQNVYDRNHNLMPNGTLLAPAWSVQSTTQGTVILPIPDSINLYYIFSLQAQDQSGKLYYSIVDMNLNGGLGDVVAGKKSIQLDDNLTEKMTVAPGNCGNTWLIVRSRSENKYKSYYISHSGVINTTPVLSAVGNVPLAAYTDGTIKFSPDNKKMAAAITGGHGAGGASYIELYDFDMSTGMLSNAVIIDTSYVVTGTYFGTDSGRYYSVCFSPDGSKLYGALHFTNQIKQFDLSQPNLAAIQASKTTIVNICANPYYNYNCTNPGDMKIGPDEKLYIVAFERSYLERINYPNLAGVACGYVDQAVSLPSAVSGELGLPSRILSRIRENYNDAGDTISTLSNITACAEAIIHCPNSSDTYLWNTGETASDITVTDSGPYWVQTQGNCHYRIDSFIVSLVEPPKPQLGPDTIICEGVSIRLSSKAPISNPFTLSWNTGSTTAAIRVSNPGTYWLKASLPPCFKIDSITIDVKNCGCLLQIPTAFSPNGDGINDMFKPANNVYCQDIKNYALQIYNRYGQLIFKSTHLQKGWQGRFKGAPVETGTYFYALRYEGRKGQMIHKKGDVTLVR